MKKRAPWDNICRIVQLECVLVSITQNRFYVLQVFYTQPLVPSFFFFFFVGQIGELLLSYMCMHICFFSKITLLSLKLYRVTL